MPARWKIHRAALEAGKHGNAGLQEAWAADGPCAFAFALLESVGDTADLGEKEKAWAEKLEGHAQGFNVAPCNRKKFEGGIPLAPLVAPAVAARLEEKGMTRADLARATARTPEEITRALNNTGGRGGKVPDLWADMFRALGLRLTVEVIGEDRKPGEERKASTPTPADLPDAGSPAGQTGEEKAPTSAGRPSPRRARKASTGEGG